MASPSSLSSLPALTLLDCPADILLEVFESLPPKDLHAVCLVCKNFHELAEPFLYSRIHWTWLSSQTPPITLLLRSILLKPQLAHHIQSLVLDGDSFHYTECAGRPAKVSVSEIELEEPIAFIEKVNVSYGRVWIQELHNGTMDAFVAVLLSQLSRLKLLSMSPNFTKDNEILGMVLTSVLCDFVDHGLPCFGCLLDVSFDVGFKEKRMEYKRNTADVLPFFYLPNVERISASIDNPITFAWPANHKPAPSTIISLDLHLIREAHLSQILSATTGLKSLSWCWHYREDLEDEYLNPIIDLDLIMEALFHVRDTLTDLFISAENHRTVDAFYHTLTIKGSFNSIVNFTWLKTFEVPIYFLLGSEPTAATRFEHIFPNNIESLTITDSLILEEEDEMRESVMYHLVILGAIRSWLEHWRTLTPHLRRISFLLSYSYNEWGPAMRKELKELGAEARIQLEITDISYLGRMQAFISS